MRYGIRYSFRLAGTTGHGAISKCLGYMTLADRFFFLDVGDCAGDFENAMVRPGGK
jgi:hypothetical protein